MGKSPTERKSGRLLDSLRNPVVVGPLARLQSQLQSFPHDVQRLVWGIDREPISTFAQLLTRGGGSLNSICPSNPFLLAAAEAVESLVLIDSINVMLRRRPDQRTETVMWHPHTPTPYRNQGWSWVEAPRGTLRHQIEVSPDGNLVSGRAYLPSWQNLWLLERAVAQVAEQARMQGLDRTEIEAVLTDLIWLFNPCIDREGDFIRFNWSYSLHW